MNYIVPEGVQVISSGQFKKQHNLVNKNQTLYVFKSKANAEDQSISAKIIPDKLGFVIGEFPYVSLMEGKSENIQIGAALFTKSSKH